MAFWNKKRKQREQEALERGMQETLDAIREKKKAMGLPLSKEEEKDEERERQEREAELYQTEPVNPAGKDGQKRYVTECCQGIQEADRQIEGIRRE